MQAALPLFQVPATEPGKNLSMILWSNAAIQTRNTNRNSQGTRLLQLLRTADQHNDTVITTTKKVSFLLPSAFRLNHFSLCAAPSEEEKGEREGGGREISVMQEASGIQNIWKLLLWYHSSYFVWMNHKGKDLYMLLQTLHTTSPSQRKPRRRVLSAPPAAGKGLLLKGWRRSDRKARAGREDRPRILLHHYTRLPSPITLPFWLHSPSWGTSTTFLS